MFQGPLPLRVLVVFEACNHQWVFTFLNAFVEATLSVVRSQFDLKKNLWLHLKIFHVIFQLNLICLDSSDGWASIKHNLVWSMMIKLMCVALILQGFAITDSGIQLISSIISEILGIECAVMMGANLAGEVASEQFCESTIGEKLFSIVD